MQLGSAAGSISFRLSDIAMSPLTLATAVPFRGSFPTPASRCHSSNSLFQVLCMLGNSWGEVLSQGEPHVHTHQSVRARLPVYILLEPTLDHGGPSQKRGKTGFWLPGVASPSSLGGQDTDLHLEGQVTSVKHSKEGTVEGVRGETLSKKVHSPLEKALGVSQWGTFNSELHSIYARDHRGGLGCQSLTF